MKEADTGRLSLRAPAEVLPAQSSNLENPGQLEAFSLMRILWRGKLIVFLAVVFCVTLGGFYAFNLAVPQYSATTRLALEVGPSQLGSIDDLVSGVSTEDEAINTELQVILTHRILEAVVEEMSLLDDPEFNTELVRPKWYSPAGLRIAISALLSGAETPEVSDEDLRNSVIDNLRSSIVTFQSRQTYIFNIRVTTKDGRKSIEIANRLARIYLENQVAGRLETTEYATSWLSNRVTELGTELREKEEAIASLRSKTDLISTDALNVLSVRAKGLRDRFEDASRDRDAAALRYETTNQLMQTRDVLAIASHMNDPTLNRIRDLASAGDTQAIETFFQRAELLAVAQKEALARADTQLSVLEVANAEMQAEIAAQSDDQIQLNRLLQDAESTRVLVDTLQTQLKESALQLGLQRADSRILSEARRHHKVAPRKSRILLLSAIFGGFFGIGIVLYKQLSSRGFRTSEELEAQTGMAVLGQVSKFPIRQRRALLKYLISNPTSMSAEEVRNLRTSLLLSNVDLPPQVFMLTSSVPGEGKTTMAISLSHNLAGLNKRVLLVENDIRRRTLNNYFNTSRSSDIVSILSGDMSLSEAAFHQEEMGFDVLMGGKSSANGADLFSSERFAHLIEEARVQYDFVVLDTPPVLAVSDARIIGRYVDAIVYCVRWDHTARPDVLAGLRKFSSLGLKVSGLVLTQVNGRKMRGYGYGYGKYNSYYNK